MNQHWWPVSMCPKDDSHHHYNTTRKHPHTLSQEHITCAASCNKHASLHTTQDKHVTTTNNSHVITAWHFCDHVTHLRLTNRERTVVAIDLDVALLGVEVFLLTTRLLASKPDKVQTHTKYTHFHKHISINKIFCHSRQDLHKFNSNWEIYFLSWS